MAKKQISAEQKRLDIDIWIIALVTMGVFFCYAAMGNEMMGIVKDSSIPIMLRLLFNAGVQFEIAGLGITIVCILRKESFIQFGLTKENIIKAILGTILCFLPYICYIFISGQFSGYQPFGIWIANDVMASGFPISILGMAIIIVVWGFFEGFNYAVICLLFHPFSTSFWGIVEIATTFIAIYGMLMVKKKTSNAWGCVFAFCFIWNAI